MQPGKSTPRSAWAAIASSMASSARAPDLEPRPGGGMEIRIAVFLSPLRRPHRWPGHPLSSPRAAPPPRGGQPVGAGLKGVLAAACMLELLRPEESSAGPDGGRRTAATSTRGALLVGQGGQIRVCEEHRDQVVERERRETGELERIGSQRRAVRPRSGALHGPLPRRPARRVNSGRGHGAVTIGASRMRGAALWPDQIQDRCGGQYYLGMLDDRNFG
ncbi:hypothetical protein U9M48_000990 [Paspalum notatum var. saurae]|uniref:Uncharacterized protein n=1 Tax=Paspalum notatum var. saurae TaxID=547442 RepID=A0AAQ3SIJ8_PASNO